MEDDELDDEWEKWLEELEDLKIELNNWFMNNMLFTLIDGEWVMFSYLWQMKRKGPYLIHALWRVKNGVWCIGAVPEDIGFGI
ncbi:MAG: hypothetical protein LBH04_01775 [Tannerellaceae bacterium]|jgi:hypothetical protein|nr:hypothetical protein [Tannerellaceae bacterium]